MHNFFKIIFIALILGACHQQNSSESSISAPPEIIKSNCDTPQKLPDDIEKQTCVYHTSSLAAAYKQVVKEVNTRQGKTTQLRTLLPLSNAEDNFEKEQLWVTFNWKSKTEILITVTSEGEETEYLMKQLNDKVDVKRTIALQ